MLVQTIRHYWPELNTWIDAIDDPRFLPFVTYHKRFLLWWALSLFLFKLGSRRQLDYELDAHDTQVLDNLNRLAGTHQQTRPVNQTLNYFLAGIGVPPLVDLRALMVRRLLRTKALDDGRLQTYWVVAVDGSGYLVFRYPHCDHCLVRQHGDTTLYYHQVLEAKLLGAADVVVSIGTEFIDNRDAAATPADASQEQRKQDCELTALSRLAPQLKAAHPRLPICLSGDGLLACGRTLALARAQQWTYVLVFKEGRLPAVWRDFQALLALCPQQRLERVTPEGVHQVYRWVHDLSYTDSAQRNWTFTGVFLQETPPDRSTTTWAWITDLEVDADTVVEVATKGGRHRWQIENQGFNTQKNSDLNLEHAYSHGDTTWASYYYLLQIAHLTLQLVEKGSPLRRLAAARGRTPLQLFGSLKNIARRLLESFRFVRLPEAVYDIAAAGRIQIRLDSG